MAITQYVGTLHTSYSRIYCKDCRFWEAEASSSSDSSEYTSRDTFVSLPAVGVCHRYPPKRIATASEQPVTHCNWWCGEAKPKEER